MKKIIFMMAIMLSILSCKKTTESITILGTWQVDSYRENGADQTTLFKNTHVNYKILFDASSNYIETYSLVGVNITNAGDWKLTNGGNDIELINQADSSMRYFHIVELNRTSATITEDNGNKSYNLLKN